MPRYLPLILCTLISGCIVYPHKNITKPGFVVNLSDRNIESVRLSSDSPMDDFRCNTATELTRQSSEKFVLPPEYYWLETLLLLPGDCVTTIFICGVTNEGQEKLWRGNYGVFCNALPETMEFNCEAGSTDLSCERVY